MHYNEGSDHRVPEKSVLFQLVRSKAEGTDFPSKSRKTQKVYGFMLWVLCEDREMVEAGSDVERLLWATSCARRGLDAEQRRAGCLRLTGIWALWEVGPEPPVCPRNM